jgi:hypothetical protein
VISSSDAPQYVQCNINVKNFLHCNMKYPPLKPERRGESRLYPPVTRDH